MSDLNFDAPALYRNFMLVLLLLAIALIVHNVFSQNGYLASRRQSKELIAHRMESAQGPEIGILLGGNGPSVVEVVSNPRRRNEFEVSKAAGVVGIHDRIEDEVDLDRKSVV